MAVAAAIATTVTMMGMTKMTKMTVDVASMETFLLFGHHSCQ